MKIILHIFNESKNTFMKIALGKAFKGAYAVPDNLTHQDVINFNLLLEVGFIWHPSLGRGEIASFLDCALGPKQNKTPESFP